LINFTACLAASVDRAAMMFAVVIFATGWAPADRKTCLKIFSRSRRVAKDFGFSVLKWKRSGIAAEPFARLDLNGIQPRGAERHAAGNHLLGGTVVLTANVRMRANMKKLALIAALLLAASPVAAQVATSGVQQPLGAGGQTNTSSLPNTGVICEEEITATFCNAATSPNTAGYGPIGAGAASSSGTGSAGSTMTSVPPCAALGPANELCN
jgi:hypothetical protein